MYVGPRAPSLREEYRSGDFSCFVCESNEEEPYD